MMQQLRDLWQGGYEGQHIEELIGSVFADFAPYAGADQQRLIFSRQHDTEAVTSLIVEDNGDYGVSCTHRHAGTVSFTSTGELQAQLALRLPLIPITPQTWWAQQQEKQKQRRESSKTSDVSLLPPHALHHVPPQLITTQPVTEVSPTDAKTLLTKNQAVVHHPLRFTSYERGAYLLTGLPHTIASAHRNGLGQLELDGTLPSLWQGRHSYGIRCGPLATRLAVTPHSEQVAQTSSVMSNEGESVLGRTLQHQQYTFDTALCIPFAPSVQDASHEKDTGHWALSLGMQHPEPYGDTLIALALQNRRMTPRAPQQSQTNTLSSAKDDKAQDEKLETTTITSNAGSEVESEKAQPSFGFRVLLVQTLLSRTLLAPDASLLSQDDETSATLRDLSQRIVSADKPWYSLPTLIGCNVSALHDLVRCSAAAIFHDNAVDLETALVVDATPLVPHTPSLLRVGWNNTGRVAVGITSLVGQALSITLGIDYTRGETPRFGIDLHA